MATRKIEVAIVGDASSLQAAFGRSAASAEGWGAKMEAAGEKLKSIGHTMTTHLTLPIVAVGAAAGKMALDFQSKMEMLHTSAGASQREVDKMSKSVLGLADNVQQGPTQLADAMYHLESVGLRGAKALDVLHVAADGAAVGNANLDDVTNALAHAVVAGVKGTGNMREAMGQLNAIVGAGDMKMQDLVDALGTGILPAARTAGLSIKDVGAVLATMVDSGTPAVVSATRLRMAFALMAAPTKKAQGALQDIGLGQFDLANQMRGPKGIIGALELLKSHLADKSKNEQMDVLTKAFGGAKSSTTIETLLQQLDRVKTKYADISKGGASFNKDVVAQQQTGIAKLRLAWSTIEVSMVQAGAIIVPVFAQLAQSFSHFIGEFQGLTPAQQKLALLGAAGVAVLGPLIGLVGNLILVVRGLGLAMMFLATNPVGLTITAIAALTIGLYELYQHSQQAQRIMQEAFAAIEAAAHVALGWITSTGLPALRHAADVAFTWISGTAIPALVQAFNRAKPTLVALQHDFEAAFSAIKALVRDTVHVLEAAWQEFGPAITSAARTAWTGVQAVFKAAVGVLEGIVRVIGAVIRGDWSDVLSGLKQIATSAWAGVKAIFTTQVSVLGILGKAIGSALLHGFGDLLGHLAGYAKQAMGAVPGALEGAAKAAISAAVGIGSDIVHGIASGIEGAIPALAAAAAHAAGAIPGFFKKHLGISSPSRLMRDEVGVQIPAGIADGIKQGEPAVRKAIIDVVENIARGADIRKLNIAGQLVPQTASIASARDRLKTATERLSIAENDLRLATTRNEVVQAKAKATALQRKTAETELASAQDYRKRAVDSIGSAETSLAAKISASYKTVRDNATQAQAAQDKWLASMAQKAQSAAAKFKAAWSQAVSDAQGKIGSLADTISNDVGQALSSQASSAIAALDNSPQAQRIKDITATLDKHAHDQQLGQLTQTVQGATGGLYTAQYGSLAQLGLTDESQRQAAIDAATAQLKQAQQDLDDFNLENERQTLQQQLDDQKTAIQAAADATTKITQQSIADLTDAFKRGMLSPTDYVSDVQATIAGTGVDFTSLGSSLGTSFVNGFKDALSGLGSTASTAAQATTHTANPPYWNNPAHFASGGMSLGGPAIVGEHGPELVELPSGARVHDARATKRLLPGGNVYVTQNIYPSGSVAEDPTLLMRAADWQLRKAGAR